LQYLAFMVLISVADQHEISSFWGGVGKLDGQFLLLVQLPANSEAKSLPIYPHQVLIAHAIIDRLALSRVLEGFHQKVSKGIFIIFHYNAILSINTKPLTVFRNILKACFGPNSASWVSELLLSTINRYNFSCDVFTLCPMNKFLFLGSIVPVASK